MQDLITSWAVMHTTLALLARWPRWAIVCNIAIAGEWPTRTHTRADQRFSVYVRQMSFGNEPKGGATHKNFIRQSCRSPSFITLSTAAGWLAGDWCTGILGNNYNELIGGDVYRWRVEKVRHVVTTGTDRRWGGVGWNWMSGATRPNEVNYRALSSSADRLLHTSEWQMVINNIIHISFCYYSDWTTRCAI